MLALFALLAVAVDEAALPERLPDLDAALFDAPAADGAVHVFAQGRLRFVSLDAHAAGGPIVAGGAYTARVGAHGAVGDVGGTVVLGDGAWILSPPGMTQPGPLLVRPPIAPLVYRLTVEVPVMIAGLAMELTLGRQPVIVEDGRFLGAEPFDARGRTLDGAVLDADVGAWLSGVRLRGALLLRDIGASGDDPSPIAVVALDREDAVVDVGAHSFVFRDAAGDTWRSSLGGRGVVELGAVAVRGSAELGLALDGADPSVVVGTSWHGALTLGTRLPWRLPGPRPVIDAGIEATGGSVPFLAPAPSQHGTLGALDLAGIDNGWQPWCALAFVDDDDFAARVSWRRVMRLGSDRPLRAPDGVVIVNERDDPFAFTEVDIDVQLPLAATGASVDIGWSVAALAPDMVLVQRLLVSLRFTLGDPRDLAAPLS